MTPTPETSNGATVAAVAVKLPPFTSKNPQTWFQRAEVKFRLSRVTDEVTRADHVLNSMSEQVMEKISGWLSRQEDNLKYADLKTFIMERFSVSMSERAQQLLALAHQPIGDQTATECWDEIQQLMKNPTTISLEREILLQRLPDSVRRAIPDAHELSEDDLLKQADSLLSTDKATARRAASRTPVCLVTEDSDDDYENDHTDINAVGSRREPRDSRRFRKTNREETTLCYYHIKFGNAAKKCLPGCPKFNSSTQTKNSRAGRQ